MVGSVAVECANSHDSVLRYPLFLDNKKFRGEFEFVNTTTMVSDDLRVVDELPI